ncbi:condensation domain-containing protein [Nonomuraea ferruginea]
MRELAAMWTRALTAIATSDTVTGHTPSDFPLVPLDQEDVAAIEAESPGLEDVLPLSPLQTGLYFHATFDPGHDPYVVQQIIELDGPLDGERLRLAADRLIGRYPNLGAAFRTTGDGHVVAVIAGRQTVPWRTEDLSHLDHPRPAVEAAATAERSAPFDLARPPAMRFALLKLGPRRHALVHTVHHILADGWSVPLILRDLLALYEDRDLPAPPPYGEFLKMLATRDPEPAIEAWTAALAGVHEPTRLAEALTSPADGPAGGARGGPGASSADGAGDCPVGGSDGAPGGGSGGPLDGGSGGASGDGSVGPPRGLLGDESGGVGDRSGGFGRVVRELPDEVGGAAAGGGRGRTGSRWGRCSPPRGGSCSDV